LDQEIRDLEIIHQ
jgi:hypothetical protein